MAQPPRGINLPQDPTIKKTNLTEGPLFPALVRLSIPIVIAQLFQTIYNVVDTFWVGRLGSEAVAAISLSFPIVFFLLSLAAGLTIAGTSLVAQHTGAGDRKNAGLAAGQSMASVTVVAVVISIVDITLSDTLLRLMGASEAVLPMASGYLKVILSGMVFMFLSFTYSSILRGVGDSVTPMKLRAISVGLNIVLDPLFIYGWLGFPEMGVTGAAVATVIARAIEGVFGVYILIKGTDLMRIEWQSFKPNWSIIKQLVSVGSPAALEMTSRSLGLSLMTATVALFGMTTVAAYGIGMRILSLVMLPSLGVGMATTTLVGQNLGAGKPERAEKTTWMALSVTFAILTGFGLLVFAFPRFAIGIFNGEPEVLRLGADYMRVVGPGFGFVGALTVVSGAFRGAGNTVPSMVFSVVALLGIQVPLAFFLSTALGWGPKGLWWAILLSNAVGTVGATMWFTKGYWKEKALVTSVGQKSPELG